MCPEHVVLHGQWVVVTPATMALSIVDQANNNNLAFCFIEIFLGVIGSFDALIIG